MLLAASCASLTLAGASLSRADGLTYAAGMTGQAEDSTLMLRYRDGDVAAFETLYRRHKDPLYRYLLRLCRKRDVAEDIFQDVWSNIIRSRKRYRPTARFTTFLYRVARNCFVDRLRRDKRYTQDAADDPEERADPGEQPDSLAERLMARQRLDSALRRLPAEQRDVFLLREEAGLSLEEIASVVGVNRETAKSRLRYAIAKLKQQMSGPLHRTGGCR
ncbi:MAG: RNA polymerase sigma factor [Woeseiaceae bacterium]